MDTRLMVLLLTVLTGLTAAAEDVSQAWIGQRFQPDQCVAIRRGQATYTRKLCRIDYQIEESSEGHIIEGRLRFNPRFVPRRPQAVDLEILLIDRQYVCVDQINVRRIVEEEPVLFSFQVPSGSQALFVRTYYTLHYAPPP